MSCSCRACRCRRVVVRRPGGGVISDRDAQTWIDALRVERDRIASERTKMLAARAGTLVVLGPIAFILELDPGEFSTRAAAAGNIVETLDRSLDRCDEMLARGETARAFDLAKRLTLAVRGTKPWGDVVVDVDRLSTDIARDARVAVGAGIGVAGVLAVAFIGFKLAGARR